MSVHDRVTQALTQVAEGVLVPEVDPDAVRAAARSHRRRTAVLMVAAAAAALGLVLAPQFVGRDSSAPPVGPQPTGDANASDRADSVRDLPAGMPPVSPYWRDGVLHANGAQITTPFAVGRIRATGDAVIVGEQGELSTARRWALVRGERLELLPAVTDLEVELSLDGRMAYWTTNPTLGTTRFVAWDTETNRELAVADVPGPGTSAREGESVPPRVYLAGIDADGIGYWYDEAATVQITAWDVRSDQTEPRPDLTEQDLSSPQSGRFWRDPSVSPDRSKQASTVATAAGSRSCCTMDLVVGPLGAEAPSDGVIMQLPQDARAIRDEEPDGPISAVWWETPTSILVQTSNVDPSGSYLVRCRVSDGSCEGVFALGKREDSWRLWSFAGYPSGR